MLRSRLVPAALVGIMLGLPVAALADGAVQGFGLEGSPDDVPAILSALPPAGNAELAARTLVRLQVSSDAAPSDVLAGQVAQAADALTGHAVVVVALREATPVDVRDGAAVDAWAERVALLVDRCRGRVAAWEIGEGSARPDEEQAFFLKRTALAVKGVDRHALVLNADPRAFPGGTLAEAVGPFVDGHAAAAAATAPADALRTGAEAADGRALWAGLMDAASRGVRAATFRVPPGEMQAHGAEMGRAFAAAGAALPADASPTGNVPVVTFPAEVPVKADELVVASDLSTRVIFTTQLTGRMPAARMVATFSEEPRNLRVFDPMAEEPLAPRVARAGKAWAAEVPIAVRPLVLAWDRARSADDLKEDVAVSTTVDPTVAEILARHFAAQAARDRSVQSYVADLSTEMRYEFGASGQAFEVRIEGRYFFDKSGVREIENQRWFINGAKYEPKNGRVPEIPLLQPEKVQLMPLEVRLDKSYEYRLLGKDDRDGRPCWKVSFRPVAEDATAYAGTVWIDRQTFDRVGVDLVQTRLESPVLTNEQSDRLGPVLTSDGEHWLVRESRVQRTVSLLGGTVGIQMRLLFSNFRVNDPGFAAAREEALASSHQMLRDTDEGLAYLRPTEGGGREVGKTTTHKLFAVAGLRYDEAYAESFLPLAGVNYLDYDLFGSGLQFNVFAAGAINTVSLANPSVLGSRVTIGVDAFIPFVRKKDRLAVAGSGVDDGEVVLAQIPGVDIEVSRPVGRHGRAALTAGVTHESWSKHDDTADDFVVPSDTWVAMLGAKGEVHAGGWDARAWLKRYQRDEWTAWGHDTGSGPPPLEGDAAGYWKWGTNVARTWPLKKLQTVGFDAQYLGGSGLDRFSQHEFSAFGGTRLPGFDGSGIHFDQAALLRLSWGVDVGGVFGAQLQLGVGRTWNRELPDDVLAEFGEESDHVGIALTGNVPGPWSTIIRFDVGTVLYSPDYEEAENNVVAQVVVLKLLSK